MLYSHSCGHSSGYCCNTVSYNPLNNGYSSRVDSPINTLETVLETSSSVIVYNNHSKTYAAQDYFHNPSPQYEVVNMFLSDNRPITQFIDDAVQIKHYIIRTFEQIFNRPFPDNIVVKVIDKQSLKQVHKQIGGTWSDGIMGFAVNNQPYTSEIFIQKDNLDKVMLVIGHELGHVLSFQKISKHDEEAKAFAFEFLWAKTIKEHNIANLSECIQIDMPALNGLHNIAFDFVRDLIKQGKNALDIYLQLIRGSITVSSRF